eukprot:Amastigsp_a1050_42.p4 type:complete len:122 gc:universal Amastigsp_a1050_42:437-802(+)
MRAMSCDWMLAILDGGNSYAVTGTFAFLRYRRNPSSVGMRKSSARPFLPARAARPTRWMYSRGSSGASTWTIQSTSGMSRPRAATSVQIRMPDSAPTKSRKVEVRFCCFCRPWSSVHGMST